MRLNQGKRTIIASAILGVIGVLQANGGLYTNPVDPSVVGWLLMGFAAVLMFCRAAANCPIPALDRRRRVGARGPSGQPDRRGHHTPAGGLFT